jgi:hypothetical protein
MKINILDEPDLEFAGGSRHIDPRHGITNYGPADATDTAVRTLRVGVIGTQEAIDGVKRWLDRCREPIAAKKSHLGHLYVPFPGFDTGVGYRSTIVWNSRLERPLRVRDVKNFATMAPPKAIRAAVDLYDSELAALNEEPNCDVVIVCRPDVLPESRDAALDPEQPWRGPIREPLGIDFHSLLKARSLRYSQPIQVIRRETWDAGYKPKDTDGRRPQQDEATRAWNLHTALYYKSGGVPWRMTRNPSDLASCYVGVAFYKASDQQSLQTSVAQVFNQRGDGVIVRGAPASRSSEDLQPHLTQHDAQALLEQAMYQYRSEHRTSPARVVLHKTSSFSAEEIEGFQHAAEFERLSVLELLWIPSHEPLRLFRTGEQPPLRGTMLSLDEARHVLYTRGSIPFYKTYPGMYVPLGLGLRLVETESSPEELAAEVLALTKMNWNATQLDGRHPITLRTADSIGSILKHLGDTERPAPRYAFYM